MKYLILVPDGAADRPIAELDGKTPLEVADMKTISKLAAKSEVGMVKTIPDGVAPGSDAANLSVMGYDPAVYLTGRSPLEAVSMGIPMNDTDVAFRTNLITVEGTGNYEDLIIKDHSAGDITDEEAAELVKAVNKELATDRIRFYPGVSYRHALIMHDGVEETVLVPPHDVLEQRVGEHLPKGEGADFITELMKKSYEIMKDHPVNLARVEKGLNPANTMWIWGQGKKPKLSSFHDKYGITGAAVSAVDLIKGIGICAGLEAPDVPGATGNIHTNYKGKADATIAAYESGKDFVYIHVEAPDECSHQGDLKDKLLSLKYIDEQVLAPVLAYLEKTKEPYRILIVPDHRTPLEIRTHSSEPVPFILYDSESAGEENSDHRFCEVSGEAGTYFDSGYALADHFFIK